MNISTKRALVKVAAILLFVAGLALNQGMGSLSSFGWKDISLICPLGAIESFFGSWVIVPRLVIAVVVTLLIAIIFGRAFCGWICPVPPIWSFFKRKKKEGNSKEENELNPELDSDATVIETNESKVNNSDGIKRSGLEPAHGVLIGSLASAAILGFPVFCLVCPVGLTFAFIFAVWHLFASSQPTWMLLFVPAVILLELTLFRKWCHKFCPLGAFLSLVGGKSRLFRPKVDSSVCRKSEGFECGLCASACPENIDPVSNNGARSITHCVRCGQCSSVCPNGAIKMFKKNSSTN